MLGTLHTHTYASDDVDQVRSKWVCTEMINTCDACSMVKCLLHVLWFTVCKDYTESV